MKQLIKSILTIAVAFCLVYASAYCNEVQSSLINNELQKIKYDVAYAVSEGSLGMDELDDDSFNDDGLSGNSGYKSPGKAFLLSLAVPGLGQYYYGSKIKSAAFLGIEATSWFLHVSWNKKGNDLTDDFEQFNRDHWNQVVYEEYLYNAYGVRDDDSVTGAPEVSHNLPDTRTQQYYEMTGKYNQFAWGWDDATLNGMTAADFDTLTTFPPAITGPATVPYSSRRLTYETMRNDANKKLDNANKMLMVVLANHLISALEAFISTKAHNNSGGGVGKFSNWKVNPSLRSYNDRSDTPYMSVSFKF